MSASLIPESPSCKRAMSYLVSSDISFPCRFLWNGKGKKAQHMALCHSHLQKRLPELWVLFLHFSNSPFHMVYSQPRKLNFNE